MDRIKIEYIYLAAIIAAFVAVLVIGFFLRRKFRKYQPVQDGLEFEVLCTQILTAKGYENVELTPTTGDYGVIYLQKRMECAGHFSANIILIQLGCALCRKFIADAIFIIAW